MNFFNLKLHNTTVKREVIAGISTFISMSYILSLNPQMLGSIGMDYDGVYVATIIATVVTTVFSAFYTKMPVAYAPAISYNIIFLPMLSTIAKGDWRLILLATYLSGALLILIVKSGVYDRVRQWVPEFVKYSAIAGVGLAVISTGMDTLHIMKLMEESHTGEVLRKEFLYCVIGLGLVAFFKKYKKRYALTFGIVITYGIIIVSQVGRSMSQNDYSIHRLLGMNMDARLNLESLLEVCYQFPSVLEFDHGNGRLLQLVVFVFLMTMTYFFDACVIGLAIREKIRVDDTNFDETAAKKLMTVNGVGGLISGCAGTLCVTAHGESLVGIDTGAKTGVSAIVVSVCFAVSLLFAPFFKMMSGYIVAPAILYVGYQFFRSITKVRCDTVCEKVAAGFIILYTGLKHQVGEGIIWGMLIYIGLQLVTGRRNEITKRWPLVLLLSVICIGIHWYRY